MATSTKGPKTARGKTPRAAQAQAASVATPAKDEAANLAASSLAASGVTDPAVSTAPGLVETRPADGATIIPKPDGADLPTGTIIDPSAGAIAPLEGVIDPGPPQGGGPGPETQPQGVADVTTPNVSLDSKQEPPAVPGTPDESLTDDAPAGDGLGTDLYAVLVNHSPTEHRLPKLHLCIASGESQHVVFSDKAHKEACEKQVNQLRELSRWDEGEGLFWSTPE